MNKAQAEPTTDLRSMMAGLKLHRDVDWEYSFLLPRAWRRYDMQDQYGFIYAPGEDPRTGFYVTVQDLSDQLEGAITAEDLPALYEGIVDGLKALPDCDILQHKELAKGSALGFEFLLTFTLDGETCKRHLCLLYNDRQQFTLYGQGVPAQKYDLFHDAFEFIYSTFAFADWFILQGLPITESTVVQWEGGGEGIRTKPLHPRERKD